jgi:hypothetical protein
MSRIQFNEEAYTIYRRGRTPTRAIPGKYGALPQDDGRPREQYRANTAHYHKTTDAHEGPHATSTQPPSLLYDDAACARIAYIVGTGVGLMRRGAPRGRPSSITVKQRFSLF